LNYRSSAQGHFEPTGREKPFLLCSVGRPEQMGRGNPSRHLRWPAGPFQRSEAWMMGVQRYSTIFLGSPITNFAQNHHKGPFPRATAHHTITVHQLITTAGQEGKTVIAQAYKGMPFVFFFLSSVQTNCHQDHYTSKMRICVRCPSSPPPPSLETCLYCHLLQPLCLPHPFRHSKCEREGVLSSTTCHQTTPLLEMQAEIFLILLSYITRYTFTWTR